MATALRADSPVDRARALQPRIAALAPQMERAGRIDPDLMRDIDAAGLTGVMVPRRFGGAGLGLAEATEVLRLVAQADVCTAWNINNYMLGQLLLARFPLSGQARFYATKSSFNAAGNLTPSGRATRVDGGFRLSGRWAYASGVLSADGAVFPAMLDDAVWFFAMPGDVISTLDDWTVSAMNASESVTAIVEDAFIPEDCAMPMAQLLTATGHHGVEHPEPVHRYPFTRMAVLTTALPIGALETAVAIGRSKLETSKPFGVARLDRPSARMRWAEAAQTLRMLQLLRNNAIAEVTTRGDALHDWSVPEIGQLMLDNVTLYHHAKDALRLILDHGGGSSLYKLDEPIQRMARDIAMICTHMTIADWDVMWEKASRMLLGVPLAPHEFY